MVFNNYKDYAKVSVYYNYLKMDDNNKGNDFQLRIGRRLIKNAMFGYEYFFSDYLNVSPYYYSPQDFTSHSIWGEYDYILNAQWKFKAGGKIGYVPDIDFIISEIWGEASYNPLLSLIITGRLGFGNSFRYESSYKSINASVTAYWGIF